jgi:hypothetical protein
MDENNQQVIIFDGPDGTGKTEICQALSKVLLIPFFKNPIEGTLFRNKAFKEEMKYVPEYIAAFLKQTKGSVIFDRQYPAEYAYAKTLKREFDEDKFWDIDKAFSEVNTKIIICHKSAYSEYSDDLVPIGAQEEIFSNFVAFSYKTYCKCFFLDTSSKDLGDQLTKIVNWLIGKNKAV